MTNHKIVRPARPTSKPKVKAPKPPPVPRRKAKGPTAKELRSLQTKIHNLSAIENSPGELNIHDLSMKEIICKCNDVLHLQGDWLSGHSLSCSYCGFFLSLLYGGNK